MNITKKQFKAGMIVFLILLLAGIICLGSLNFFKKGADEVVTPPSIRSSATATYELNGQQADVVSNDVALEYQYIDPPVIETVSLVDAQIITVNPYIITVKMNDPTKVDRIDFYVDNVSIGTSTLPDVEGVFECSWDTSKYHSLVKIVVQDIYGREQEIVRQTTVNLPIIPDPDPDPDPDDPDPNIDPDPSPNSDPIVDILPKTGAISLFSIE